MTDRALVGQLFMVGFDGTEITDDLAQWLCEYHPGGIILFARNLIEPVQIARLTSAFQERAPHGPLLIAIDQEGGRVSRLPKPFTIFPPAAVVAAGHSTDLAYRVAEVTANELHAVGINMNMAPVLDIDTNPLNPIIGDRAFAKDPGVVCAMGAATIAGHHDQGVVACGKHFPGHGETTADSHKELPTVTLSKTRLQEVELKPFRHAIAHGLRAIMSAHVRYPALDDAAPATLSRAIMTDLLRKELGFTGLLLSDDLEMQAIVDHLTIGEASVQALRAGVDMLLICHRRDRHIEAVEAVERALADGRLSRERLEASLARLEQVRRDFLTPAWPVVDPCTIPQVVGCPSHGDVLCQVHASASRG